MVTKVKKDAKQNIIYVILSCSIILIVYLVFQCIILFQKPTNSILVKNGRLTNYEEVVGYVIREEEIIDTSGYLGSRQIVITDASRASKDSTIVSYISDEEEELTKKIAELDLEIQEVMETQEKFYSADVKNIESDIQKNIYSILDAKNNIFNIIELKKNINKDLEKKASIVGELSPIGSKLNTLIEERMKYEKILNDSKKDLIAEKAGLISYRVDGYENILTPNSFSKLTIDYLKDIKLGVNQIIPINEEKVKTVNNFYTYLAVPIKSEEGKKLQLNDKVKIAFNGDLTNYTKANVEYILEDEEERLVILKTTSAVEMLTRYRKVSFDIIWWNYEGLKVPNNAIYDKKIVDELTGQVYCSVKAVKLEAPGYEKEVWVKVGKFVDDFSIIENYEDEELLKMGIPKEMIDDRYQVSVYDNVILN